MGTKIHLAAAAWLCAAALALPAQTKEQVHAMADLAEVRIAIPNTPAVLGVSMTTQWLEWTQMTTSNAIEWTVANAISTQEMTLVEGHPGEAAGEISVYLAHVLRFEFL